MDSSTSSNPSSWALPSEGKARTGPPAKELPELLLPTLPRLPVSSMSPEPDSSDAESPAPVAASGPSGLFRTEGPAAAAKPTLPTVGRFNLASCRSTSSNGSLKAPPDCSPSDTSSSGVWIPETALPPLREPKLLPNPTPRSGGKSSFPLLSGEVALERAGSLPRGAVVRRRSRTSSCGSSSTFGASSFFSSGVDIPLCTSWPATTELKASTTAAPPLKSRVRSPP
mmetsp:Transcript_15727/g.34680  ORF Transcript_15727/g.34680 Transcript_15727/m.34680 type:complete len:226 (-) Transcript_15727:609-1286(-)